MLVSTSPRVPLHPLPWSRGRGLGPSAVPGLRSSETHWSHEILQQHTPIPWPGSVRASFHRTLTSALEANPLLPFRLPQPVFHSHPILIEARLTALDEFPFQNVGDRLQLSACATSPYWGSISLKLSTKPLRIGLRVIPRCCGIMAILFMLAVSKSMRLL